MMAVMVVCFLLQVFQRFTNHKSDNASAGDYEQTNLFSMRKSAGKTAMQNAFNRRIL